MAVRGYRSNLHHVKLPRRLLEADHLINLPILKAHASMVFSCALKNIKGVVQDAVHLQMHQQNLTMAMMDVWSVCRADINIVDAIRPASGYSPHTPVPIEVGCILGSSDPVAVDLIACDLVASTPRRWITSGWLPRPDWVSPSGRTLTLWAPRRRML